MLPPKFAPKQKSPKMALKSLKKAKFGLFYLLWWTWMVKLVANYVWNEFRVVSEQKVLVKKKFRFFLPEKWPFLNFDLIFKGYVLLSPEWAERIQVGSKH